MSSDGFFDDMIEEPELEAFEGLDGLPVNPVGLPDGDTYDAFNEDTFGNPLEGDWESEHDKLLLLENENGFDGTLTKFDDFDDKFNGSDEEELESGHQNGNLKEDMLRMGMNNVGLKHGSDLNLNNTNMPFMASNMPAMNEMQLKLFQQLQLQQQQQLLFQQQQQFQKNQLLQQQAAKQAQLFQQQQQQANSSGGSISPHFGMLNQDQKSQFMQQQQQQQLMLAALMARNSQMQQPGNMFNQFAGNNMDRKTPINFNSQFNDNLNANNFSSNTNTNNNNLNQLFKNNNFQPDQATFFNAMKNMQNNTSNNEDAHKIRSFLEKMSQNPGSIQQQQQSQESTLKSESSVNPVSMLSMLQQQAQAAAPALPKLPPTKVKTLEEIESELLASNQPRPSSSASNKSSISASSSLNKFFPMLNNNGNSHMNNYGNIMNQQGKMNDNSENTQLLIQKQKQLLEQLNMNQKQQQIQQFQQQNQMLNSLSDLQQQQQLILMQQQIMSSQLNLNAFLPPNFQTLNQPQKQMVLNQIQHNLQLAMLQQQQQQQQMGNNTNGVSNGMNNMENILNNDMNNNRYNDNMKNRSNSNNNNGMNNQRHQMFNNNNNNNSMNNQNRQGKINNNNINNANNNTNNKQRNNSDRYDKLAGMMTDKEKNWVTNVQMLQLQIDDPYRYDFYYTAWMLKKKQFSQRNTSSGHLKTSVIQSLDNKYTKDPKNYRPLTFENSLGKVTMSNFHHPRALIDVKSGDDQSDSELAGQISELDLDDKTIDKEKNIDTILLEIEKMYQVLLYIDEIEHSILKANDEMRAILFQDRRAKVDKLALMLCTENFAHYLFVDKGKRLLSKSIPTFNMAQTKLILGFFMQYIYIIAKNNISLDELYSHISYAIDTQKFADLVDIVNQFVHLYSRQSTQLYHTIFSNKFCLSFLLKFFSKSDLINQDDFETDQKITWSCFLNLVLVGLTVVQPISTKPDGTPVYNICEICQLNLDTPLENFDINKEIWNKNESKLRDLFSCN